MDYKKCIAGSSTLNYSVEFFGELFLKRQLSNNKLLEKQIAENQNLSSPSIDESEKEIKNEITRNECN